MDQGKRYTRNVLEGRRENRAHWQEREQKQFRTKLWETGADWLSRSRGRAHACATRPLPPVQTGVLPLGLKRNLRADTAAQGPTRGGRARATAPTAGHQGTRASHPAHRHMQDSVTVENAEEQSSCQTKPSYSHMCPRL